MIRAGGALALLAIVALLLTGCSSVLGPRVTIVNDTNEVFTIEADGVWVGTVGPRARATLPVPLADDATDVVARDAVEQTLVSIGGTRSMWDDALDGSTPMIAWQDFACGRILIATEPFDPTVPGPIAQACP